MTGKDLKELAAEVPDDAVVVAEAFVTGDEYRIVRFSVDRASIYTLHTEKGTTMVRFQLREETLP